MFDQYQSPPPRRRYGPIYFISVAISLALMLWRCELASERHSYSYDRSSMYAQPTPPIAIYEHAALPGMSIDLPGAATLSGTYRDGAASAPQPFDDTVLWELGAPPTDPVERKEDIDRMIASLGRHGLPGMRLVSESDVKVGGASGHKVLLGNDAGQQVTTTETACGGRRVEIIVGGMSEVVAATDTILKSFVCTPDPKQDLSRSDIVVTPAPGWAREMDNKTLVLVGFHGLRVAAMMFDSEEGETVAATVRRILTIAHYKLDAHTSTRGDKTMLTGTVEGGVKVAALAWRCGDDRTHVFLVTSHEGSPVAPGVELAATGRCLPEDEAMPPYPPAE
jgi:hypothetical protein